MGKQYFMLQSSFMSVFLFLVTENIFILQGLPAAVNKTLLLSYHSHHGNTLKKMEK
jgi:hypothetical protein